MPSATTQGEKLVLERSRSGEPVDLGELSAEQRLLASDLLRGLCIEGADADPRGLCIKGAFIQGRLDLSFCTLERPLAFVETRFSEPPCFDRCSLPHLSLRGCSLPGLEADALQVRFDLDLRGIDARGAIRLIGARIGGQLNCDGATLVNDGGGTIVASGAEIHGDLSLSDGFGSRGVVVLLGAKVGGNLLCEGATLSNEGGWALAAYGAEIGGGALLRNGFTATGEVLVSAAKLGGNLECDGATLSNEGGWALVADGAEIGGGVSFRNGFSAKGGIGLNGARMHALEGDGATLVSTKEWALAADSAVIGGTVQLRDGFSAEGGVSLHGAKVGGNLELDGARLVGLSGDQALQVEGAEIGGSVLLRNGFTAVGGVVLEGATLGGNLECDGAMLVSAGEPALRAGQTRIGGSVHLRQGFTARGSVWLLEAILRGNLDCSGATLVNDGDLALVAEGAEIGGDAYLREGFDATGGVRLRSARVGGNLECDQARFAHPGGWAIDANGADVGAAFILGRAVLQGGLILFRMRCATLLDDLKPGGELGSWAGVEPLRLEEFTYDRFGDAGTWDPEARFSWLRSTTRFDPGSWQQLIDVYRAHGEDENARRAAIAMENDRLKRGGLSPPRRVGRWILRVTIGYGYRPFLALAWAVAVVVPFALLVSQAPAGTFVPKSEGAAGGPQPLGYSLDTFLPIVNLGEADQWTVTGSLQWAVWTVILLGWALTTIFVAGFTRLVRNV